MLRNLPLSIPVLWGNRNTGIAADYLANSYYTAILSTLYQDSSKTTPVAADGDPVGAWVDSVGGVDGTQGTTAAKPTFRENDNRLVFDGSSDFLQANAAAAYFTGTDKAFTVLVAANVTSVAATMQFLSLDNNAGSALMEFRSNAYYISKRDDANTLVSASVAGATTGKRLTAYACSGTTVSVRNNGVVVINEAAFNVGATTLNVATIGRRADVGVNFFTGDLYRLAIYTTRLSDDDIALIEAKWNSDLGLY